MPIVYNNDLIQKIDYRKIESIHPGGFGIVLSRERCKKCNQIIDRYHYCEKEYTNKNSRTINDIVI